MVKVSRQLLHETVARVVLNISKSAHVTIKTLYEGMAKVSKKAAARRIKGQRPSETS